MSEMNFDRYLDATVFDRSGDKLGKVAQLFLDNETKRPTWVTVVLGLFGSKESYIPLTEADFRDGEIHVPYEKDKIKESPQPVNDHELTPQEEDQLRSYYGTTHGNAAAAGLTGGHGENDGFDPLDRDHDGNRLGRDDNAPATGGHGENDGFDPLDRDHDGNRLGRDDNAPATGAPVIATGLGTAGAGMTTQQHEQPAQQHMGDAQPMGQSQQISGGQHVGQQGQVTQETYRIDDGGIQQTSDTNVTQGGQPNPGLMQGAPMHPQGQSHAVPGEHTMPSGHAQGVPNQPVGGQGGMNQGLGQQHHQSMPQTHQQPMGQQMPQAQQMGQQPQQGMQAEQSGQMSGGVGHQGLPQHQQDGMGQGVGQSGEHLPGGQHMQGQGMQGGMDQHAMGQTQQAGMGGMTPHGGMNQGMGQQGQQGQFAQQGQAGQQLGDPMHGSMGHNQPGQNPNDPMQGQMGQSQAQGAGQGGLGQQAHNAYEQGQQHLGENRHPQQ